MTKDSGPFIDSLSDIIAKQHEEMNSLQDKLQAAHKTIEQMKADQIDEWETQADKNTKDMFKDD